MTNPKTDLHRALLSHLEDTLDIIQGVIRVHPEYASLSPLEAVLKGTIRIHQDVPKPYPTTPATPGEASNDSD